MNGVLPLLRLSRKAAYRLGLNPLARRSVAVRNLYQRLYRSTVSDGISELALDGYRLRIPTNDSCIAHELRVLGAYEPFESSLFRSYLSSSATVVDVGAHVGYYSLMAGVQAKQVFSFEPCPANCALLRENVALNGFNNVIVMQAAVADYLGEAPLYLASDCNTGHNSLAAQAGSSTVLAKVVTLDSVIPANLPVSLLKIDTEGGDAAVLRGAKRILQTHKPVLFLEVYPDGMLRNGDDPLSMLRGFTALGYTLRVIDERHKRLMSSTPEQVLAGLSGFCNILAT